VILNGPRVGDICWADEVLRGQVTVFLRAIEGDHTLGVEATSIGYSFQEQILELSQFSCMRCCSAWRFVDGFVSQQARLARQLGSDLVPQSVEFLFDLRVVRTGLSDIGPCPGVMMNVDKNIHVALENHVDHIRYSLEPDRVDYVVRNLRIEMICPCHCSCQSDADQIHKASYLEVEHP
jgi:hypothetical protein